MRLSTAYVVLALAIFGGILAIALIIPLTFPYNNTPSPLKKPVAPIFSLRRDHVYLLITSASTNIYVTDSNAIITARHTLHPGQTLRVHLSQGRKVCQHSGNESVGCRFFNFVLNDDSERRRQAPSCFLVNSFDAQILMDQDWTIDPDNPQSLNPDWIEYALKKGMDTWQAQTSYDLWGDMNPDLTIGPINVEQMSDANGVRFATVEDSRGNTDSIIAVTLSWYTMIGSDWKIIRWNHVYNTAIGSPWGNASTIANVYDLQNIGTHELGHSIGLGDINDESCTHVTMFGQGSVGEVLKRSLATPDITGEQILYGEVTGTPVPPFIDLDDPVPPIHISSASPSEAFNPPVPWILFLPMFVACL
jgi:hypothetical protein